MSVVDEDRVKRTMLMPMWLKGGGESLVKVTALDTKPDKGRMVGYCTQLKFIAGRTPLEMELNVGLRAGTKLLAGAEIFLVAPLPAPSEFELAGYSHTPEGISTRVKPAHPDYPPGLGVPQWNLSRVPQSRLVWLAKVLAGERFRIPYATVPMPIQPRLA